MKHLPLFTIQPIPHKEQNYDTCGDYQERKCGEETCCDITVSELSDWKMEALVAVHELVEYILVKDKGIKLKSIDAFDIAFEKKRKKGNTDEPGDNKKAPYYKQHQFATKIEGMLAEELKVKWSQCEKAINNL